MNGLKIWLSIGVTAVLFACGGGGGNPGTTSSTGSSSGSSSGTAGVADFAMFSSKTSMTNSGTDKVQLTVIALDENRNVVPDASVLVSTDQNSVFAPGSKVTDASGSYTGVLSIGGDKADRTVTATVTINGIVKRTSVRVVGSRLSIQATPGFPSPGQAITISATLLDVAGNPIPDVPVTLAGSLPGLQGQTVTTGLDGSASKSVTAPASSGVFTISASGGGVSAADYPLNVFSSAVPAAVIPAGATPSLSASPNVLAVNSVGSAANKSTLRFLFLDAANKPVQNVRVRFEDRTTGLAAVGASVASGTSTLYTDASGVASTQYVAGQNSSPTNGVSLRACYSATDFSSAAECPNSVGVGLTVAGQALAVSVGDDNLLSKGAGTYTKQFAVTVADSAGRAVANAPIGISADLTHYGKGNYGSPYLTSAGTVANALTVVPSSLMGAYPSAATNPSSAPEQRVWCPNEDVNRNGNVDPGENTNSSADSNGQATLEPRKSDLVISYANPSVTSTDANGVLLIKVEYSQRFATWLAYRVIVTTNVLGSQGMAERLFVTDFLKEDEENGSFRNPPYGIGSCGSSN